MIQSHIARLCPETTIKMNKLFIVLLAVCLVNVHAFVKREAEAPKEKNSIDEALKSLQETAKGLGEKMSEVFKPENIQKQFSDLVEGANKAFKDIASIGSHKEENKQ